MNLTASEKIEDRKIEAYRVSQHARMGSLPRHFGRQMGTVENAIYNFLRELAAEYHGAYWHFYELSNGGFYAAPEMGSIRLCVPTNGYEGQMTADAAGITVCLFTFSHLSFQRPSTEVFSRHFHWLRDFAMGHSEAGQIFAAID